MKLSGGIFVLVCVIEMSGAAQWVADHENITVCYKPKDCTLFDWRYTSNNSVQLIRWQYEAPGSTSQTIMAATTDTGDASYVADDYKGRVSRDSSSKAAMKFCQMKESDKDGTYSVEVTLTDTGLLGIGYVDEITDCALPTTAATTTTSTSFDPCQTHKCYNGGTCWSVDRYTPICNCTHNYNDGGQCQYSGCIRQVIVCRNGGTCIDTPNDAYCSCLSCWGGEECTKYQGSSNPCEPTPCVFGTCSIDCASTYMCKCFVNYQGRNCSHRFAIITGPPTSGPPDIIVGSNYTFNLTTNTTADLWWSYEQNGPAIVKNNQATFLPLQISPVYLANNTQYYFGCAKIDPYVECKRYSVHAIYNWVFEEPEADMNTSRVSRTVRVGEYLTINCTITGEPLPYVQWWLNVSSPNDSSETIQQFISNASIGTASLIIDSISLDDITTYYCRASFLDISLDRTVTLVLDEKTPLSTGAKAGIGAAVACITVIVISSVIYVLKKKQTHGNTFCKNNQPTENGKTEQETSKGANDAPKEKNSMDEGQMNTSTPASVSGIAVEDDRVPSLATDTPRKLPPLNLPPVNRVNPEDNADVQEHEMKRKKKKKHKKRHHDEKEHNADPEQNGETNPEYNEGEYEEV